MRFKAVVLGLFVLSTLMLDQPARADGDAKAGAALVSKCEACHGRNGVAPMVEAPNLVGQKEFYIVAQLTAFKTGQRQNAMMSVVAPDLSDQDIDNLAAYFASIPVTVGELPK